MDTRNKIISADAAVEIARQVKQQGRRLTVVTGYFDVLGAAQVRGLIAVRKGTVDSVLMVILLPRSEPLLPLRARAELVAGLSMVDYVVSEGEGLIPQRPRSIEEAKNSTWNFVVRPWAVRQAARSWLSGR